MSWYELFIHKVLLLDDIEEVMLCEVTIIDWYGVHYYAEHYISYDDFYQMAGGVNGGR